MYLPQYTERKGSKSPENGQTERPDTLRNQQVMCSSHTTSSKKHRKLRFSMLFCCKNAENGVGQNVGQLLTHTVTHIGWQSVALPPTASSCPMGTWYISPVLPDGNIHGLLGCLACSCFSSSTASCGIDTSRMEFPVLGWLRMRCSDPPSDRLRVCGCCPRRWRVSLP